MKHAQFRTRLEGMMTLKGLIAFNSSNCGIGSFENMSIERFLFRSSAFICLVGLISFIGNLGFAHWGHAFRVSMGLRVANNRAHGCLDHCSRSARQQAMGAEVSEISAATKVPRSQHGDSCLRKNSSREASCETLALGL